MDKKLLLIIGAGIEQIKAYQLAKKMGLLVAGTDINSNAPGFKFADYKIKASTRDISETVKAVKKFHQSVHQNNGIMTLANDVPLTVASIAKELGLPGISIRSARLASDKILMKDKFKKDGILIPPYKQIFNSKDLFKAAKAWRYPLVIKPADSRGARGVLRITKKVDHEWAFNYSLNESASGKVLVEKFIGGLQISAESFVYKGVCHTVAWSERNYEFMDKFAPYIIENGGILPANLNKSQLSAIKITMQKCADSMNIKNGSIKGDLVMTSEGPVVIEVAARLSGGFFCTDQIPKAVGVDLVKQTIKISLGMKIDVSELEPKNLCALGIRYFFPKPGKITKIEGFDQLKRYDWVFKKLLFKKVGEIIEPYTDHTKRVGLVITVGKNREEANRRAVMAVNSVTIETSQ